MQASAVAGSSGERSHTLEFVERLLALPSEILCRVLHCAGRPVRLTCRHFYITYGALTGGLILSQPTPASLVHGPIPLPNALRFAHVHALTLRTPSPPPLALLSALAPAFPALRDLEVSELSQPGAIAALAPLARTLTHLSLVSGDAASFAALPSALPALRSLEVDTCRHNRDRLPDVIAAIAGRLPHLEAFACTFSGYYPAASVMSQVAGGLPALTRLELLYSGMLKDWNSDAAATLASAWPKMADLALSLGYTGAAPPGMAAALARHTALTRLELGGGRFPDWELLQQLRLQELHVSQSTHPSWFPVAAQMGGITRLVLGSNINLGDNWAGSIAQMASSLLSLSVTSGMHEWGALAHLSCLSRLQDLTLERLCKWPRRQAASAKQVARALAAGLTSLRRLDVMLLRQPQLVQSLVARLSAHGVLRELRIEHCDMAAVARLPAVAGALARLHVAGSPLSVLAAVTGLGRLHYLGVEPMPWDFDDDSEDSFDDESGEGWDEDEDDDSDGDSVDLIESGARPGTEGAVRGQGGAEASTAASRAAQPNAAEGQVGGAADVAAPGVRGQRMASAGERLLPPQLRVLCVAGFTHLTCTARLQELTRQHGCHMMQGWRWREADDCAGYLEGASWQWRHKHGVP